MRLANARCHVVRTMGNLKLRVSKSHLLKRMTVELRVIQVLRSTVSLLPEGSGYSHDVHNVDSRVQRSFGRLDSGDIDGGQHGAWLRDPRAFARGSYLLAFTHGCWKRYSCR